MPITSNSATITVSDSGSLKDAYNTLSRSGGGTIEVAQGARPIEIALSGGGGDHVNIVSANDRAPTLLHRISFDKVENVTVSDFRIDSSDVIRPDWHYDLMVSGGGNIAVKDSVFTSDALGRYSPNNADTILGEKLALVRNSKDFSFEGNSVSDYYHGLSVLETIGVSISENEFSGLQGDGLRLAGVQQTEISGNKMHDFVGTTRNFNHNDFIQVWSTNTNLLTRDLIISGNTLDAGDGSSAQGIFVGNERYSHGEKGHRYQNIDIFDNIVHSGNTNGIAVFGSNDVNVTNNSVLWNKSSKVVDDLGESGTNRPPLIRFTNVTDGSMIDNIAKGYISGNASVFTGNKTLSYTQPDDPNYVGANFIDALGGGAGLNFQLRVESAWDGVAGAPQTWSANTTPPVVTFPEPKEELEPEVTPEPEKLNIGEAEETPAAKDDLFPEVAPTLPTTGGGEIAADVDFETVNSLFKRFDTDALVQSGADTSYLIEEEHTLQIDRQVDALHGMEAFSLEMDVTADTNDLSGALVHFYKAFEVTTARDGALRFKLETDDGTFYAGTDGNPLADGKEHRLGISYDDDLGKMSLRIDDVVVAESEASGVTADRSYYGLTVGHTWAEKGADSFSMLVDELVLRTRISDDAGGDETFELAPVVAVPTTSPVDDFEQTLDLARESTQNDGEIFL